MIDDYFDFGGVSPSGGRLGAWPVQEIEGQAVGRVFLCNITWATLGAGSGVLL